MTTTPHKHAALIKRWADGAKIEWYNNVTHEWEPTGCPTPCWDSTTQYRVKPEPKPDIIVYQTVKYRKASLRVVSFIETTERFCTDNVMFVFDGETGMLKDVQLLAHE